jgi:hypothetical protein
VDNNPTKAAIETIKGHFRLIEAEPDERDFILWRKD